jgi:nucleoside-diphosphate-sugar epimerase
MNITVSAKTTIRLAASESGHRERFQCFSHSGSSQTTKARHILKWDPKINLEEGLKRTYDYFQKKSPNQHTKALASG